MSIKDPAEQPPPFQFSDLSIQQIYHHLLLVSNIDEFLYFRSKFLYPTLQSIFWHFFKHIHPPQKPVLTLEAVSDLSTSLATDNDDTDSCTLNNNDIFLYFFINQNVASIYWTIQWLEWTQFQWKKLSATSIQGSAASLKFNSFFIQVIKHLLDNDDFLSLWLSHYPFDSTFCGDPNIFRFNEWNHIIIQYLFSGCRDKWINLIQDYGTTSYISNEEWMTYLAKATVKFLRKPSADLSTDWFHKYGNSLLLKWAKLSNGQSYLLKAILNHQSDESLSQLNLSWWPQTIWKSITLEWFGTLNRNVLKTFKDNSVEDFVIIVAYCKKLSSFLLTLKGIVDTRLSNLLESLLTNSQFGFSVQYRVTILYSLSSVKEIDMQLVFESVLSLWGDKETLQRADVFVDREITQNLALLIHIIPESIKTCTNVLFSGIQHHIDNTDSEIRVHGMFIAELYAKLSVIGKNGNEVTLDFGISNTDPIYLSLQRSCKLLETLLVCGGNFEQFTDVMSKCSAESIPVLESTIESDTLDEIVGEEDMLDLPTIGKPPARVPMYLHESLAALQGGRPHHNLANESDKQVFLQAALEKLPEQIVRSSDISLNEALPILVRTLIHVEAMDIDQDNLRNSCLITCVLQSPNKAIPCLVNLFYEKVSTGFPQRIMILNILVQSAKFAQNNMPMNRNLEIESIRNSSLLESFQRFHLTDSNLPVSLLNNTNSSMNHMASNTNKIACMAFDALFYDRCRSSSLAFLAEDTSLSAISLTLLEKWTICISHLLFDAWNDLESSSRLDDYLQWLGNVLKKASTPQKLSLPAATKQMLLTSLYKIFLHLSDPSNENSVRLLKIAPSLALIEDALQDIVLSATTIDHVTPSIALESLQRLQNLFKSFLSSM